MVFEALVVETDTFFEKGTIVVRIPSFYFRKMNWDLSEDYPDFLNDGLINDKRTYDFEAYVYSPYGGGSNFGTFFLPQVNQRGIVMAMDKHLKQLVWLGSFFMPTRDDNWNVKHVNFPTDDMNKEGEEGYGVLNGEQNMLAEDLEEAKSKNFVARFKTTDKNSAEGLNWEERPTSNIISIGDNSFFVTHFSKDEGWEDKDPKKWTTFSMEKDEEGKDLTELKRVDVYSEIEQKIALSTIDDKESIIAQVKEKDTYGKVVLTKDGINIEMDKEGDIYSFSLSSENGNMKLSVNGNDIELDKDGKLTVNLDDEINISSGDVIIEPNGKVKIGSSNFSALARYKELEKIIGKLEKHIHVAPTGPTTAPLESNMSPIPPGIMQDKRNMETKTVEAE